MRGRPWEYYEDEYLRRYYKIETISDIEMNLERSRSSVYQRVYKLGLQHRRDALSDEQVIESIERFHTLGWSDAEIMRSLRAETGVAVDRHRIGRLRKCLGLPSNKHSEHGRERVRQKTQEQLAAAGLPSIGYLRVEAFNKWKRELGWPEHLTVRAVQAAELFWRRGPMTRMQLCAAMGIDKKRRLKRTEPTSNAKGGTVLAELQRAGLVMRLPKQVKSGRDRRGGARTVDLYLLNPGVAPHGRQEQRQSQAS